jgi:hypothetical protein
MSEVPISSKYKNLQLILSDSANRLDNLPKTKRHLELVIRDSLRNNRKSIVIGGLRNIGKTVILKQLAVAFDNSLYVSFQNVFSMNEKEPIDSIDVAWEIINLIKEGNLKLLLLDEVTRLSEYGSSIKEILDTASRYEVSVVITGSARHALKNRSYDTWGARVRYVELGAMSFYEYLNFTGKLTNTVYADSYYEFKSLKQFCDTYDIKEEWFLDYLKYNTLYFSQNIESYISMCYMDMMYMEGGDVCVNQHSKTVEVARKLFYVLQYKLVERFSSKNKMLKAAKEHRRERLMYKLEDLELSNCDTILNEYAEDIQREDDEVVFDANSMLRVSGMLIPIFEKTKDKTLTNLSDAADYYNSGEDRSVSSIFNNPCFTGDINLYMALVSDLLTRNNYKLADDFLSLFRGAYKGVIVEYYIAAQEVAISKQNYSVKLKFDGLINAGEIDILSESTHSLIEVGIGGKTKDKLAFCDENFTILYPEYKDFKKIYVSARPNADESNGYLEVPYWKFGVYCDMVKIRRYIDSTN